VELLPREEVALLLASLTACAFLILGVLDVVWPATRRRRVARDAPAPPAVAPTPAAPVVAVRTERPLPPAPAPLAVGRLLLERAGAEADLERRVTILTRAVAGLTRSAQATPDDSELAAVLDTAHARLWQTWEEIARARLAAAMPWGTAKLPAPVALATRPTVTS
jgi:hypothetical protein